MVAVNHSPFWYNYCTTDWQRVYKECMMKPKINMWYMNFIERQGMMRFKVFLVKCMMLEVLFKICRMPEFFFTKKIVGEKGVVSYSPVFSFISKCFPGFPFNWSRTKEIKCRNCFFPFRLDWYTCTFPRVLTRRIWLTNKSLVGDHFLYSCALNLDTCV